MKPLVTVGCVLGAAGMFYLTGLGPNETYVGSILPALILAGLGFGLIFAPAIATATLGVAADEAGIASAMVNTSQQVGGSIGVALLSTITATAISDKLAETPGEADPGRRARRRRPRLHHRLLLGRSDLRPRRDLRLRAAAREDATAGPGHVPAEPAAEPAERLGGRPAPAIVGPGPGHAGAWLGGGVCGEHRVGRRSLGGSGSRPGSPLAASGPARGGIGAPGSVPGRRGTRDPGSGSGNWRRRSRVRESAAVRGSAYRREPS